MCLNHTFPSLATLGPTVLVRASLVRHALPSGSEMTVPNTLALATGHALAAVDPAPGKTYDKGLKGTGKAWIQCQMD